MADEKTPRYLEPTRVAFSLLGEFKNFAFKGNVVDLAVGVIIGAAFSKIVDSLVKLIIMPLIGTIAPGNKGYSGLNVTIHGSEIKFGDFLGELLNFLLVAFVLFIFIVKFLGWIMRSKKQEAAAPPPPTKQEALLMEIRDLLKQKVGA